MINGKRIKEILMDWGHVVKIFFSDWTRLFREVYSRTYDPIRSVDLVFYFLFFVLFVGGIGLWIDLVKGTAYPTIHSSMATFSLTLSAASFATVILFKKPEELSDENEIIPSWLIFPYTCFFLLIAASAVLALIICNFDLSSNFVNLDLLKKVGKLLAKFSLISSLFFWWQVNAKNPLLANNYLTEDAKEAARGDGEQIDPNDTDGFKV